MLLFFCAIFFILMVCAVRGHFLPASQRPHRGDRAPVVEYRGRECGAVFTLFPGTFWAGTHDSCTKIVLILGGVAQGIPPPATGRRIGM